MLRASSSVSCSNAATHAGLVCTGVLHVPQVIRSLLGPKKYVIVVEHDLAVLDYLSDFICCLYGKPGAYGVVTMPFSVREGINIFLAGFVPTENLRFREEALTFKVRSASSRCLLVLLTDFNRAGDLEAAPIIQLLALVVRKKKLCGKQGFAQQNACMAAFTECGKPANSLS